MACGDTGPRCRCVARLFPAHHRCYPVCCVRCICSGGGDQSAWVLERRETFHQGNIVRMVTQSPNKSRHQTHGDPARVLQAPLDRRGCDRSFMPRVILGVLLVAVAVLVFAIPWATRPFRYPPQGLHPTGWTYSRLIRERYPRHIVDPAWLSNDMYWSLAESGARTGVLVFGATCVCAALRRFSRHVHTTA